MSRTMRTASHKEGSKISDTGTAVITIKLCSLPIPLEPRDTSTSAVNPMAIAQNARSLEDGVSELDIDTDMTYVIESPVVATKTKVKIMNSIESKNPMGMFCVMASKAAGRLKPSNAADTVPACANSIEMPVPPTMVNQKLVTKGATNDNKMIMAQMERPRLMRATNTAINGP